MSFVNYTSIGGERWDYISYIMYGDSFKAGLIIEANPQYSIYDTLPAGCLLNIPVLDQPGTETDISKLPPWKR